MGLTTSIERGEGAPLATPTARAWALVLLLALLYVVSFVDRYIVIILSEEIGRSLSLSDGQLGLLIGAGFSIVYTLAGLPLANWIDVGPRLRLVAAGVVIWSLCTIGTAFASGYLPVLACRSGVAIGEAVLTPAAISLIGDLFPPGKRTLPTTVFVMVGGLMGSGAFILGGAAVDVAAMVQPWFGWSLWRVAMVVVGVPGLILAPILLAMFREPARNGRSAGAPAVPFAAWIRFVGQHRWFWICLLLAESIAAILCSATIAWAPILLIRDHGATAADAGYIFGTAGLVGALAGTAFWSWLITLWPAADRSRVLLLLLGCVLSLLILAALMGAVGGFATLLAGVGATMLALAGYAMLPPLIIQTLAPPAMHARFMAAHLTAGGLIGMVVGAWLPPVVARLVFAEGEIALAIMTIALVALPFMAILFGIAFRQGRQLYGRAAA